MFILDGTCFKLAKPDKVKPVYDAGKMSQEAWDKYCEGRKAHLTKHLTLAKNNKQNYCRRCERRYFVAASQRPCMCDSNPPEPKYDFEKDEDVLNCEI